VIHTKHGDWIEARGISLETASIMGLFTKLEGGKNWLAVPYLEHGKVINHKYRTTGDKGHMMDKDAPLCLFNLDCLEAKPAEAPLIITEGEWDCLAAIECGFRFTVSVPNGAPKKLSENPHEQDRYQYLWRSKDRLDKVQRFVLATDSDGPGLALAADLARWLGPERCMSVQYPDGCKDLGDVLKLQGSAAVAAVLTSAKPYPVKGLYRLEDFPEPPPMQSLGVDIPALDDNFQLTFGTFSVITGWAGHGKTSLLMVMLANLLRQGVPMALGSFETIPRPILERRMRAAIYGCNEYDAQCKRHGPADELLSAKFGVIAHSPYDDETELSIEYIIELAKVAVMRDGIRLLVLDPWNEIEHKRMNGETETEYAGRAIRLLKRFAKNYECAVWLVAHPRKPSSDGTPKAPSLYDLAGSAHFANKSDYGLVIHRDDLASSLIKVTTVKVRMGLPGKIGQVTLDWDKERSCYTDPNVTGIINQFNGRYDT
jgi:twinkle protein